MLKLLKYDLKYMIKNMLIFYVLGLFFSILTRIIFSLNQTVFINLIGQISVGCLFSMLASIIFNTIIRSWVRFSDSIYKDESYLTHTLPVTRKEIYESRFIESLIFTLVGFIIVVISLLITYYTNDRIILFKDFLNTISKGLDINIYKILISIIIILFLEIINIIQVGFLGMILGHRTNNNKVINSFIYGFISYLISQTIVVLFILLSGLFNKDIMSIFTSNIVLNNNIFEVILILLILIYTTVIFIINIISYKSLETKVNIE